MTAVTTSYFVLCPANYVTGGPEALHQLVAALRSLGRRAFICYYPFDAVQAVPSAFLHYGVETAFPADTENETIVVPESATGMLRQFKKAKGAVWWLSVDYYFAREYRSAVADAVRRARFLLTRRDLGWREMRAHSHYCQSAYAAAFVASRGLACMPLSDYSTTERRGFDTEQRQPRILFNPKKGFATTQRLMKACPALNFQPLVGMTRDEVRHTLEHSMVYIDFGQHPGRDRMPREAAMAGCCVVTGRRGSAAFAEDVPIPDRYKLDEKMSHFEAAFRSTVETVISDFSARARDFDSYRQWIAEERARFRAEVEAAFPVARIAPG
jgi:hypothetical protein